MCLAVLALLVAAYADAENRVIRVTLENSVVMPERYARIRGAVTGLRQDERATIDWRDALGRLIDYRIVERGKAAVVPFEFEMIAASTTFNRIICRAGGRGKYPPATGEASLLTPLAPEPWEDYRALLWPVMEERFDAYLPILKATGFQYVFAGRGESPEVFLRADLDYVITSLVRPGRLHQDGQDWERRLRTYLAGGAPQGGGEDAPSSRTVLALKEEIATVVAARRYTRPAAYSLGQAFSLTSEGRMLDVAFDAASLDAFRDYLRAQYGSAADLARAWGGGRRLSWAQVKPATMLEMVGRAKAARRGRKRTPYNFAPWMEHQLWLDGVFTSTIEELAAHARSLDPATPVGLMGCVTPSAFSGIDYLRLGRVLDFLETDGARVLPRMFRGRLSGRVRMLSQIDITSEMFGRDVWDSVLSADHGAVVLDDETFFAAGGQVSQAGRAGLRTLEAAKAGWVRMLSIPRDPLAKAAIYYSRPSLIASTLLDVVSDPADAKEYIAQWRPTQATYLASLRAWCALLESLGIDYEVVTATDWQDRLFDERPYSVLIVPKLLAAGNEDFEAIRRFAASGRPVIADNLAGVMTSVGRELSESPLDVFFGVTRRSAGALASDTRRRLKPAVKGAPKPARCEARFRALRDGVEADALVMAEEGVTALRGAHLYEVDKTDAVLVRPTQWGGLAVYLNLSMLAYAGEHRSAKSGQALRRLMENLFAFLDVRPAVTVRRGGKVTDDVRTHPYHVDELFFVGLLRRDAGAEPSVFEVQLPARGHVYNLVTRKYYGPVDRVLLSLGPSEPALVGILPYKASHMELSFSIDDAVLTYTAEVIPENPSARIGHHLFDVRFTDDKGREVYPRQTFVAYKGWAKRDIVLSRDMRQGRYRLSVYDLITNARAYRDFTVDVPGQ